ncbi:MULTISPECIES: serine-threonine protein kinase [unclassified Streptomyces]|uniref:serine-threonine protein kinase n=1 Tax=unclassified Streptomyces TaxID=2593676 RepID=UPI002DDC7295|nr:serine-threonine protein kinase [Streptomyces sp. NBC_01788]WSB25945.1 serine-threonine protein kinase [Streptomyces sp. NBC_01788]
MADPDIGVAPYWELTFDADGDVDGAERDRLLAGAGRRAVRDLIVFAHGWNNDRSSATRLYGRFFAPIPWLAPAAGIGYVGVVWPSMRFCDEPIPDFPRSTAAGPVPSTALGKDTRKALRDTFPGRAEVVDALARMLDGPAREPAALEEFGRLLGRLTEDVSPGPAARFAADTVTEGVPQREPAMFARPAAEVCAEFAGALAGLQDPGGQRSFTLPNPWNGAKELLRQATYYTMKRRAGVVGERGLGPVLGRLAQSAPGVRVHLVGHSFGGRLVSFALNGLPEGARPVKSVTLLQGAFSHYAFASRLPGDPRAGGVLRGRERRVDGPLVCCHSRFDTALGTLYPLASRMADDDRSVLGVDVGALLGPAWGAMGHDGVRAVPGTRACALAAALAGPFPVSGCVNVDVSEVVRRGGPPAGAHSDILHPELARVVLAAGRVH